MVFLIKIKVQIGDKVLTVVELDLRIVVEEGMAPGRAG